MNLTDLQLELRLIEDHIATLHSEIEKMKPQPEEEKKADFEQVTKLAAKNPIEKIGIKNAPIEIKKLFFTSLSYILLQEETDFYNRILYLCRLAKGCGFDTTAENLYKLGLEFEMNDLNKLCQEISDYKYTYLVEMLVMANISEGASESIFAIVTDFASAFEISKEELRVLGMIAKGVLIDNVDFILGMPIPSKNMWSGKLKDYLSKAWIEQHRIDCGLLCTKKYSKKETNTQNERYVSLFGTINSTSGQKSVDYKEEMPCVIKKRVQAGSIVKKGDVICTYNEKKLKKKEKSNDSYGSSLFRAMLRESMDVATQEYDTIEKDIKAPCDGVAFFVDAKKNGAVKDKADEYIAIYVVSYFDEYSVFSAWHKGKFSSMKK